MPAGHPSARRAGVSAIVGTGGDRPGGNAETGRGISGEFGDRVRGGVGWGHGRRRQGEVPGS